MFFVFYGVNGERDGSKFMFEIVTFVENDEVEKWLQKILGSVTKWKVSPTKLVINNGMKIFSEEYNKIIKDYDLGKDPKAKKIPLKVVINNGMDNHRDSYNQITKEYDSGIDIVKKVYDKMGKPVIIEYTDQLGNYNLLFKSGVAMFSLRQHPKESKIHFANRMAENIKQVHFFK